MAVFFAAACVLLPGSISASEVRLFAAASTATAVQDLEAIFEAEAAHADKVRTSFAASSVLAKQLSHGAPADVFLSASLQWMDFAIAQNAVDGNSVVHLLSNKLQLIAPVGAEWNVHIEPGFDLLGALGGGYLAIGDPDHVPAGIYARQALESLGVWKSVSGRLARAANARATLVLVERAEATAGIVYATDAAISKKVMVKGRFPPAYHDPIVYPVALTSPTPSAAVRRFFEFLASNRARDIWRLNGFELANSARER
ncbi:MAG: molybdate ABC transporter substrate-binding protein [Rhodospirillales bacterium]|nr:molybdate ABC transporter substrate-binding protein [Rhodospirillales bacterium]